MKKPIVFENFVNGSFSHYSLIDSETHVVLWQEIDDLGLPRKKKIIDTTSSSTIKRKNKFPYIFLIAILLLPILAFIKLIISYLFLTK